MNFIFFLIATTIAMFATWAATDSWAAATAVYFSLVSIKEALTLAVERLKENDAN